MYNNIIKRSWLSRVQFKYVMWQLQTRSVQIKMVQKKCVCVCVCWDDDKNDDDGGGGAIFVIWADQKIVWKGK